MSFESILQAISVVGFPIVCCGVLFYILFRTIDSHKTEMEKINGVIDDLKETVANNTAAITTMNEKFTLIIETILSRFQDDGR